jgi:hypothetical protein
VEFFFCRQTSTIHSQRFILLCKVDQVPPPSETYAVNLPSPCAPAASESPSPAPLNGVSVRWPDSNELVQAAANGVLFNTCPPFSPFTAENEQRKWGIWGGRGWAAAAAAGGRTRACVRRPAPWWRAWRSAACAFGGAAGLRRHLVCAHRGCWGGAVRQIGAGAVGGGGACAAIASRGRRRRDGLSRPFSCAPSRRTGGRRHCRGP